MPETARRFGSFHFRWEQGCTLVRHAGLLNRLGHCPCRFDSCLLRFAAEQVNEADTADS
jgi:hypothetical protein